mmetsp:Transcript_14784/g.51507  ORF Transcript_14784/g.51507 Transcript_14784/m.51507 type:complete len:312 (-) Transcript_14784:540-1475(-)
MRQTRSPPERQPRSTRTDNAKSGRFKENRRTLRPVLSSPRTGGGGRASDSGCAADASRAALRCGESTGGASERPFNAHASARSHTERAARTTASCGNCPPGELHTQRAGAMGGGAAGRALPHRRPRIDSRARLSRFHGEFTRRRAHRQRSSAPHSNDTPAHRTTHAARQPAARAAAAESRALPVARCGRGARVAGPSTRTHPQPAHKQHKRSPARARPPVTSAHRTTLRGTTALRRAWCERHAVLRPSREKVRPSPVRGRAKCARHQVAATRPPAPRGRLTSLATQREIARLRRARDRGQRARGGATACAA